MHLLYFFSVWLHILAAAVWIGGMVFFAAVLAPVVRRPENQAVAPPLVEETGLRFRLTGWLCLALLLLTGLLNLVARGFEFADLWSGLLWRSSFGGILAFKLLSFAVVLVISGLHDFSIGPRAIALWREAPASAESLRLRRQASWIGRINLVLALLIVALGVMLVRGWPW